MAHFNIPLSIPQSPRHNALSDKDVIPQPDNTTGFGGIPLFRRGKAALVVVRFDKTLSPGYDKMVINVLKKTKVVVKVLNCVGKQPAIAISSGGVLVGNQSEEAIESFVRAGLGITGPTSK